MVDCDWVVVGGVCGGGGLYCLGGRPNSQNAIQTPINITSFKFWNA